MTAKFGTPDCRQLRRHIFSDLSPIAGDLAVHYVKTAERANFEQANHQLQDIHEQLRIEDLNLCADHEELHAAAKRFAQKCYVARQRAKTNAEAYQAALRIVDH